MTERRAPDIGHLLRADLIAQMLAKGYPKEHVEEYADRVQAHAEKLAAWLNEQQEPEQSDTTEAKPDPSSSDDTSPPE